VIDFHNHLLPDVDDGASDLEESRRALEAMRDQGVDTLVATAHLAASTTEKPALLAARLAELDAAFAQVRSIVDAELPELRLERGVELMLDSPHPELSDPRVRLGGTTFLLVEFPGMTVPPHSVLALRRLSGAGWNPIVAHPERYSGLDNVDVVRLWRREGAFLQVNTGSLLGRYGSRAERTALALLACGLVDYLSSDYHARGRLTITECHERLRRDGAQEQLDLLTEINPRRMLAGQTPLPVPPLPDAPSFWRKLLRH
jgi:protein-tyrosine phosphatase